jgi:hypothetical protein
VDSDRFDLLTRAVPAILSRRSLAGALGLGTLALPILAEARKKHKKRKKIKRNAFGCVNVGGLCRRSGQCCSGICQGKKGKKKCQPHDSGACQAGQIDIYCAGGTHFPCTTSNGLPGSCYTTTGQAGYCAYAVGICVTPTCANDADCRADFGDSGACVVCPNCQYGTRCVGLQP